KATLWRFAASRKARRAMYAFREVRRSGELALVVDDLAVVGQAAGRGEAYLGAYLAHRLERLADAVREIGVARPRFADERGDVEVVAARHDEARPGDFGMAPHHLGDLHRIDEHGAHLG